MQNLRRISAITVLFFLSVGVFAEEAARRAAGSGALLEINGQRVLHLYGANHKERGFAHGYLLAEYVRDDADAALSSLPMFTAEKYEKRLLPWAVDKFEWDEDASAELSGIWEGIEARLGADQRAIKALGRDMKFEDLKALNVVADYFGPACAAFSAAAENTAGLGVVHARSLDFPIGPKAVKDQVLIVSEPLKKSAGGWVGVGWPGLIVQFSGMNADGLVVCIHDAYNVVKEREATGGFIPRGLLLRRMLERIDLKKGDPAEAAAKLAGEAPVACGNLYHLSWPTAIAEKAKQTPSAVIEIDSSSRKAAIRRMEGSGELVLSNHFIRYNQPLDCERFKKMTETLSVLTKHKKLIGLKEARQVLMAAEQPVAAHSIYFLPDKLELHIALAQNGVPSPRVAPTAFKLSELFKADGKGRDSKAEKKKKKEEGAEAP